MHILVVGSGGREHALAWKLAQEAEVSLAPGNPGMANLGEMYGVRTGDLAGLIALADRIRPDLVVVGPEDPLLTGLADELRASGHAVFGPAQNGAMLEGSKAWAKKMMQEAGIPTAAFRTFTDASRAFEYSAERFAEGRQVAVKASGPALGKGVVVCASLDEAEEAIGAMLIDREFGDAGAEIVIEDRLLGREFSLLSIVSDGRVVHLPAAQDYKRALDGDRGPNTGGMGSLSPAPQLPDATVQRAVECVVEPMVALLQRKGVPFRGCLFSGLMVVGGEPYCLEYNVRFGDPETQSVVRRVGTGFAEVLRAAACGEPLVEPAPGAPAACTVVLASAGYPRSSEKGVPISIGEMPEGVEIFHAGTSLKGDQLVTEGGRVLGVSAAGSDAPTARALAYEGAARVEFRGKQMRSDIGS